MLLLPSVAYADTGQWVKYSANPVLSPTPNTWDADYIITSRVIFDGSIYRMWYVGGHGGSIGIGYANSTDGITWQKYPNAVLTPGPSPNSWDSSKIGLGTIIRNGTGFLMWYQGISPIAYLNGAIGLATSPDGITWTKFPGNPILKPTEVDQKYISSPFVVRLNSTYRMWYTAKSATDPDSSQITRILYASSYDGIHWTKLLSPALTPSTNSTAWDSLSVFSPTVIFDGSNFGMWYSGMNQSLVAQIGYATSLDGGTWTRSSDNPILRPGSPGSWDSAGVQQPSVAVGNGFLLYYDGFSNNSGGRIGLALGPHNFVIPEFSASALDLFLGLVLCTTVCMSAINRQHEN